MENIILVYEKGEYDERETIKKAFLSEVELLDFYNKNFNSSRRLHSHFLRLLSKGYNFCTCGSCNAV